MPIPQYFKENATVSYRLGTVFDYTTDERAKVAAALRSQDIYVNDKDSFKPARFDLTQNYILPYVTTQAVVDAWSSNPMQFWQNQLQFALWCATAGCGVSVKDHILDETLPALLRSVYIFHVYYQTRRILAEMGCPLPAQSSWDAFNNGINKYAYQKICGDFGIDYNQAAAACHLNEKHANSGGLGRAFNYATNYGYTLAADDYDSRKESFTQKTTNDVLQKDYISQEDKVTNGFVWSMLDKSQGFTTHGVPRINDSVRAYAWAILGAQSQSRTSVLGGGAAHDAQLQFADNVETVINAAPSADGKPSIRETSITQYQDVLQYARSKLDYILGEGIYMVPSDMTLRIGTIAGYNNEIQIAEHGDSLSLGTNVDINTTRLPPAPPVERGKVDPPPTKNVDIGFNPTPPPPPTNPSSGTPITPKTQDHESTKTAITVAAIGAGFAYYFLYR